MYLLSGREEDLLECGESVCIRLKCMYWLLENGVHVSAFGQEGGSIRVRGKCMYWLLENGEHVG